MQDSAPFEPPISLVVGLGNPGSVYEGTRHNLGFYLLGTWVRQRREKWRYEPKFQAEVASILLGSKKIFCLKPQTFMNQSGISVQAFCAYHHVEPTAVLVVCDDISIPFGQWKVSTIPGTAGHNGVKSVAASIGNGFIRYRVGLGTKPALMSLSDYVLSRFSEEERRQLPVIAETFERNLEVFIDKGVQKGLNEVKRYAYEHEETA